MITITGISKGAGMIHPNMATMLAFIATDLAIPKRDLQALLKSTCANSFNAITIDGDTSTNDACLLSATSASGLSWRELNKKQKTLFSDKLSELMQALAKAIVCDAEGGVRCLVKVMVVGARNNQQADLAAKTIAQSLLVKTAMHGGDANWGRIIAALGRIPIHMPQSCKSISLYLDQYCVFKHGELHPQYREAQGAKVFAKDEFTIRITLGRGPGQACCWTSDLGGGYIDVNAHYRS